MGTCGNGYPRARTGDERESSVTRLAVMAHYDPVGEVAPHTRRHVEALVADVEEVVVVSTADLGEEEEGWLRERVRLVRRENYGYDFLSYARGLEAAGDLSRFDEVVICNDSFVGPLRPYREVFAAMAPRAVDFWGLTRSDRVEPHLQSFFVVFRPWVVESEAFTGFWSRMIPLSDRRQVILQYEVGLTTTLAGAGFSWASFYEESDADRSLARRRVRWWAAHRVGLSPSRATLTRLRRRGSEAWNPAIALADVSLDGGRLPYVKIDTLRYDPYGLGAGRLLAGCEDRFPEHFDGVREWLDRTAVHYPTRPNEVLRRTPGPLRPLTPTVRYHR